MSRNGEQTSVASEQSESDRLGELRSHISDLGYEIDSRKTSIAAAIGGAVFLLLLAAGALYDLTAGKAGVWIALGFTRQVIWMAAVVFGVSGIGLLAWGVMRHRRRDARTEQRLAEMQLEYEQLSERKSK